MVELPVPSLKGAVTEIPSRISTADMAAALHKFKSKLTVVAALSDVISRAQNVTAEQAGRLKLVGDSARSVADGLHDLIETGKVESHQEIEIDLCALAGRAVVDCEPLFELRTQQLIFNPSLPVATVCNYEIILEAVRNLLSNSSKHTQPGSKTYLSVGVQRGHAFIEVADNGPGISCDNVAFVMERSGSRHPIDNPAGNGIGLAVVQQAVEAHGGMVNVASVPGHGAVVTMFLPVLKQAEKAN